MAKYTTQEVDEVISTIQTISLLLKSITTTIQTISTQLESLGTRFLNSAAGRNHDDGYTEQYEKARREHRRRPVAHETGRKRGRPRKPMTDEQKQAISQRMKNVWSTTRADERRETVESQTKESETE